MSKQQQNHRTKKTYDECVAHDRTVPVQEHIEQGVETRITANIASNDELGRVLEANMDILGYCGSFRAVNKVSKRGIE